MIRYILFALLFGLSIYSFSGTDSTFRIFTENNLQGLENEAGQVIIPAKYAELGWSNGSETIFNGLIGFRKDNKWGMVSIENSEIAEPGYTNLYPLNEEYLIASIKEKFYNRNLYGLITTKNKIAVPFSYYALLAVKNQLIATILDGRETRFGLIDRKGSVLIPFQNFNIKALKSGLVVVENKENKKALYDLTGQLISSSSYDQIEDFGKNYLKIEQKGKFGLIELNGNIKVPAHFKDIRITNSLIEVLDFSEWKILSSTNEELKKLRYDKIVPFEKGLAVWANGTRSILDSSYKFIDPDTVHFSVRYDSLIKRGELYFAGTRKNGKYQWEVFNNSGKLISEHSYEEIGESMEGLIAVKENGYWGFIDHRVNLLIPGTYQSASPFRNGISLVTYYDQFGLIDYGGQWVSLPLYQTLNYVYDQTYIYIKEYSYGIIQGKRGVVYKTGNKLEEFNQMVLETNQDGKYGLVDLLGNVVFETDYDTIIFSPATRHYILKKEGEFELYDISKGKRHALSHRVDEVYQPSEGYFGVKANGKYGFVDRKGKLRISNRYDSILPLKNDLIPFKLRGKWGLINLEEQIVVQPLYENVDPVTTENIIVRNEAGFGILDSNGAVVINTSYDVIETLGNGHLKVTKDGKSGILDQKGNILASPRFQYIEEVNTNHYIIQREGKYGLITKGGISTIPPLYRKLIYDPYENHYLGMNTGFWRVFE